MTEGYIPEYTHQRVSYRIARPCIETGDIILFFALPFRAVFRAPWGQKLTTLGGWLSNWIIVLKQRGGNIDESGFEYAIHAALPVHDTEHDEVMLYEYISGMTALTPKQFSTRHAAYTKLGGKIGLLKLTPDARRRLESNGLMTAIKAHREDLYSWSKLPLAALRIGIFERVWTAVREAIGFILKLVGIRIRPRMFCSEAVVALLLEGGAWPTKTMKVWRNGWTRVLRKPARYSPSELPLLSIVDLERSVEIR